MWAFNIITNLVVLFLFFSSQNSSSFASSLFYFFFFFISQRQRCVWRLAWQAGCTTTSDDAVATWLAICYFQPYAMNNCRLVCVVPPSGLQEEKKKSKLGEYRKWHFHADGIVFLKTSLIPRVFIVSSLHKLNIYFNSFRLCHFSFFRLHLSSLWLLFKTLITLYFILFVCRLLFAH